MMDTLQLTSFPSGAVAAHDRQAFFVIPFSFRFPANLPKPNFAQPCLVNQPKSCIEATSFVDLIQGGMLAEVHEGV